MERQSSQQLLREYVRRRSEAAFAELVRRHVDLVYSTALRVVRNHHLAEEVTQGVFAAFAQNARRLRDRTVFSGWLHRTAHNLAVNTVRAEERRRVREQEAAAVNDSPATEPDALWERIAPQLDDALGELSEADRDALLLRYFQGRSAREIARTFGISEEAAQKRVNRAVARLRDRLRERGAPVGASGLVAAISANAVQSAPVGLPAVTAAASVTAIEAIAMTTMHKALVGAALAAAVGTGIGRQIHSALERFARDHEGRLPEDLLGLSHHFDPPLNDAILKRYRLLRSGMWEDYTFEWLVAEIAPRLVAAFIANAVAREVTKATSHHDRQPVIAHRHKRAKP